MSLLIKKLDFYQSGVMSFRCIYYVCMFVLYIKKVDCLSFTMMPKFIRRDFLVSWQRRILSFKEENKKDYRNAEDIFVRKLRFKSRLERLYFSYWDREWIYFMQISITKKKNTYFYGSCTAACAHPDSFCLHRFQISNLEVKTFKQQTSLKNILFTGWRAKVWQIWQFLVENRLLHLNNKSKIQQNVCFNSRNYFLYWLIFCHCKRSSVPGQTLDKSSKSKLLTKLH